MGGGRWLRSLRHDGLRSYGQVQNELAGVLVEPYRPLRAAAAAESARLEIPEVSAAVPDPDLPDARPLPG